MPRSRFVLLLPLLLAACARSPEPARPAPAIGFELREAQPLSVARERIWDGVVEATHQATLSAQTAGRVLELPFDVNDYVEAGQVVVRFTDVEQVSSQRRAAAAVKAAQATLAEAEANYQRTVRLVADNVQPRTALEQATAARAAARAQLEAARAGVNEAGEQVDYTVIRAPYSGILTERHVEPGESVRPGQPLVSGLSLSQLRVQVEVPQSEIAALRQQPQASVILADGQRIEAVGLTVFPYADPKTHSFKVRVDLPEVESGLHPGMTVKTAFRLDQAAVLLVPATALVQRSEVTALYVLGADQRMVLRQVRLGQRRGAEVEVLAGLVAGERYAADPLAALSHLVAAHQGAP